MMYDFSLRKGTNRYEKVVEPILAAMNGMETEGQFSYDREIKVLRISGKGYTVLGAEEMKEGRRSLLYPLPIRVLDIRNTQIHNLSQLQGLDDLEILDIRDTLVIDLSPLNSLPALKRVIVNARQFPEEILAQVRDGIEIDLRLE